MGMIISEIKGEKCIICGDKFHDVDIELCGCDNGIRIKQDSDWVEISYPMVDQLIDALREWQER